MKICNILDVRWLRKYAEDRVFASEGMAVSKNQCSFGGGMLASFCACRFANPFPYVVEGHPLAESVGVEGGRHGILVIFGSSDIWSDKGHTLVFTLRRGNNELNELRIDIIVLRLPI